MPSPAAAWAVAVRVKSNSVQASITTRFWIADSSPPENAKPPTGNIESPNCNRRASLPAVTAASESSSELIKRGRRASAADRDYVGVHARVLFRRWVRAYAYGPAPPRRQRAGATRAAPDKE